MRAVIIRVNFYDLKDKVKTTVKTIQKKSVEFFEKGLSKPSKTIIYAFQDIYMFNCALFEHQYVIFELSILR